MERERFDGIKIALAKIMEDCDLVIGSELPVFLIEDKYREVEGIVKLIEKANYQEAYKISLRLHHEASELRRELL